MDKGNQYVIIRCEVKVDEYFLPYIDYVREKVYKAVGETKEELYKSDPQMLQYKLLP